MRAMLCSCKNRLVASDDEALLGVVLDHLRDYHPVVTLGTDRIRELVCARSYEFNEMVGVGANPEEEFGIDPFQSFLREFLPGRGPSGPRLSCA